MMIIPAQIKAGRSLVGLKQGDVAKTAGISLTAYNNIENGKSDPRSSTLDAIHKALESAGIEFIPGNGSGPGVRLRESESNTT